MGLVDDQYGALGRVARKIVSPDSWSGMAADGRREALAAIYDLLRDRVGVSETTLRFVGDDEMAEVVGDPGASEGLAFDPETCDIYVPERHLAGDELVPVAAGLAHEIRHAWQWDVARGRIEHPEGPGGARALREAFETYDPLAPAALLVNHPLEIDAQDAGAAFGTAFQDD